MKTFIQKTIIFSLPVILLLVIIEILLRRIPNDYSYKNNYLTQNAERIETLFLGSSHAYYGINPDYFTGNSFNASHVSQSIDLDYLILSKFSKNLQSLKYIIIPVEYFTLFTRTSTHLEYWRLKNYNIHYNFYKSSKPTDYFEIFSFSVRQNLIRILKYYFFNYSYITCSSRGYGNTEMANLDLVETGKNVSAQHTVKNMHYLPESIEIINEIISISKEKNASILFYTSPCYSTYNEHLDSLQYNTTVHTIDSICRNHPNTRYVNLLSDTSFTAADFRDANHLNQIGAKKLTLKIQEIVTGL